MYELLVERVEELRNLPWQFPVMGIVILISVAAVWLEHLQDKKLRQSQEIYTVQKDIE